MQTQSNRPIVVVLAILITVSLACSSEPTRVAGPPSGWEADGEVWWRVGADTSGAFRDLETLQSMRVKDAELTYAANMSLSRQRPMAVRQLSRAVKISLLPIIRNEPEVVDSLFERHVVPRIRDADFNRDPEKLVDKYKKEGYRILARHFREPRTIVNLGTDVPVVYPDSLRESGIGGRVVIQVRLNSDGEPVALKLLEPVHPVLDEIAMDATTKIRWQPAYLLIVGKSDPVPSWVRFTVNFQFS